jgi:RND family efflux transporter MFP subunit
VQAGDVIAYLDPERFELALASAQADHELAEKTLSRVESLKTSGTVSQAELDEAVARAKLTGLAVETAQKDLDDTVLRAPFAGQLTKRLAENFSPVARLSPVIRLAPVERIEVVIGVPEQLMARLNPSTLQSAAVRFTADPDRLFEAQWLDYEAEASRDTQTYDVRFSLTETPPWPVLPGMTATVLLSMATPSDAVIQLPLSAVQSDAAGNFFVWTVERDSSVVAKRPIEVGLPSRKRVPVLSGLELGEQVVAAGGAWLHDGMQVRPLGDG